MAERSIGLAKDILAKVVNKHHTLNFAELETTYIRVASIMNKRPLTARLYNEDEFVPISPSDLLLGCTTNLEDRVISMWEDPEQDMIQLQQKQEAIADVVDQWWTQWQQDSFSLFCPRKKWTTQHRNLQQGDIVLVRYQQQLGKDRFRLGKVTELHPDKHGAVRTVTVGLRDQKKSRREQTNQAKTSQTTMTLAVQRLVVLLPADETWSEGLAQI